MLVLATSETMSLSKLTSPLVVVPSSYLNEVFIHVVGISALLERAGVHYFDLWDFICIVLYFIVF